MSFARDEFTGLRFGRYEVVCRLAQGGNAEIFLGSARTGPFVGLPLVIKRMLAHRDGAEGLQELIDEAKVTASLNHPNIARIYDIARAGNDVVLVMEFIAGATLAEIRRACRKRGEVVPLGLAISAICDSLAGLHSAHCHLDKKGKPQPVTHCDVTPGNLMTDFSGVCRVLDFGIARVTGAPHKAGNGMVRGTAAYMSPEQVQGMPLDYRSDIFSLGSVFHELLTGSVLFGRETDDAELDAVLECRVHAPSSQVEEIPHAVDEVVLRALKKSPGERWSSALEMRGALLLAARNILWSSADCGEFLRQDFAAREQSIETLMKDIRLSEDPTMPVGSPLRKALGSSGSLEPTLIKPTQVKPKRSTRNSKTRKTGRRSR